MSDTNHLIIRVDDELKSAIQQKAHEEDRSMAAEIRTALRAHVAA